MSSIGNHERLRIGIIGYGGRGSHLVRGAGFATPGWTKRASENAKNTIIYSSKKKDFVFKSF